MVKKDRNSDHEEVWGRKGVKKDRKNPLIKKKISKILIFSILLRSL